MYAVAAGAIYLFETGSRWAVLCVSVRSSVRSTRARVTRPKEISYGRQLHLNNAPFGEDSRDLNCRTRHFFGLVDWFETKRLGRMTLPRRQDGAVKDMFVLYEDVVVFDALLPLLRHRIRNLINVGLRQF